MPVFGSGSVLILSHYPVFGSLEQDKTEADLDEPLICGLSITLLKRTFTRTISPSSPGAPRKGVPLFVICQFALLSHPWLIGIVSIPLSHRTSCKTTLLFCIRY